MGENLEQLLEQSGLLTGAQLAAARADAARTRKRLPETLIDLGLVTERRFAEWIASASGTPLIEPIPEETARVLQKRITPGIARELEVVPVRQLGEELFVAAVNPLDTSMLGILTLTTGMTIKPVTGVRSSIERMVDTLYPRRDDFGDITILPKAVGTPLMSGPFEDGNESPSSNEDFGTMIATPPAQGEDRDTLPPVASEESTAATNPFVDIERRLDQIARMMQKMQKQLDSIEAMLTRVVR